MVILPAAGTVVVDRAWQILSGLVDPEIPAISIVDLGIVDRVAAGDRQLEIELLPTFIGCPALELIRSNVLEALDPLRFDRVLDIDEIRVTISFAVPWTADRISERGREALATSGFAPPGPSAIASGMSIPVELAPRATCPYCGSRRTLLENAFGPTRCRSIHYCTDCRQPFEQFKDA